MWCAGEECSLEELFPGLELIGLFLVQSAANHSCLPVACATTPDGVATASARGLIELQVSVAALTNGCLCGCCHE